MNRTRFITHMLPLCLIAITLVGLNAGLYGLLRPTPAATLPYHEDFADTPDFPAYMMNGDWVFRDGLARQNRASAEQQNYILPVKMPPNEAYVYRVRVRHAGERIGGGIIFNLQARRELRTGHLVRFWVGGENVYLLYGYFNNDYQFISQGQRRLPDIRPADARWHTLEVRVADGYYAVWLDEQMIADGLRLRAEGGWLGLSSAVSEVLYDEAVVE